MDVLDRFLRYVTFDTTSDENSSEMPSTEGQRVFGAFLADEMHRMGFSDVKQDENGYVYGFLLPTDDSVSLPAVGFISHLDTSPSVSGKNVRPAVTVRDGEEVVVSDKTTLLGADDKAGIAEILSACAYFLTNPAASHRRVCVCFTPDEEIGRGADRFDLAFFGADWAYTVDGGELGEIQYENFNAASADVTVRGINIHPGEAKGRMKNAVLLGNEFLSALPEAETPARTEGYEGFYHVCSFAGDESSARLSLLIRDHDLTKFEERKAFLRTVADALNTKYGSGTYTLTLRDSYYNMREKILPHKHILTNAENAMRQAGVEPKFVPIRGGTDGARLSYEGLPCPNLSTGGIDFHSLDEYIPVASMEKMVSVLIALMK